MAQGLTNKQIAVAMNVSYETVKEHVQHIFRKIGLTDRTQAAVWAVRNNLGVAGVVYASGGTSSQRRSCHDCTPSSANCTPLAPSRSDQRKGASFDHVLEEQLPLGLEGVVVGQIRRHFLPAGVEVDRLIDVGIPDRPRRDAVVLDAAAAQSGHRAALRAVDLQRQEIVAADPHAPRRIELQRRAVLQLEDGIRGIVGRGRVGPPLLVARGGRCGSRPGPPATGSRRTGCRSRTASGRTCRS